MTPTQNQAQQTTVFLTQFLSLKTEFLNMVLEHNLPVTGEVEQGMNAVNIQDLSEAIDAIVQAQPHTPEVYLQLYHLQQKTYALGMQAYTNLRECYLLDQLQEEIKQHIKGHIQASNEGMAKIARDNPEGKAEFDRTAQWGANLLSHVQETIDKSIESSRQNRVLDAFFYFEPPISLAAPEPAASEPDIEAPLSKKPSFRP